MRTLTDRVQSSAHKLFYWSRFCSPAPLRFYLSEGCGEGEPLFIKGPATNESVAENVKDECFTHDHI